jgi:hypothetical protein
MGKKKSSRKLHKAASMSTGGGSTRGKKMHGGSESKRSLRAEKSAGDVTMQSGGGSSSKKKRKSFKKAYKPRGDAAQGATWSQAYDFASGATYFVNNVTGEVSWNPPADSSLLAPTTASMAAVPYGAVGGSGMMAPPPGMATADPYGLTPAPQYGAGGGFGSTAAAAVASPYGGFNVANPVYGSAAGSSMNAWEEVYDSATDSSYWVNAQTGEFTYQPPMAEPQQYGSSRRF